jgi:hypothetical protein
MSEIIINLLLVIEELAASSSDPFISEKARDVIAKTEAWLKANGYKTSH